MKDREIEYEQRVEFLTSDWAKRIERFADEAVTEIESEYMSDREGLQNAATERLAARLLNSERWANVKATDISDIAYEAVCRELDSGR